MNLLDLMLGAALFIAVPAALLSVGLPSVGYWNLVFFAALSLVLVAGGYSLKSQLSGAWQTRYWFALVLAFLGFMAVSLSHPALPSSAAWPIASFLSLYGAGIVAAVVMGVGWLASLRPAPAAPAPAPAPSDEDADDFAYDPARFQPKEG